MKRPLAAMAAIFCLGIACGLGLKMHAIGCYGALVFGTACSWAAVASWRRFAWFLAGTVFFLGACCATVRTMIPAGDISRIGFVRAGATAYWLRGTVASGCIFRNGNTSFVLGIQEIASARLCRLCRGSVLVTVAGRLRLPYGQPLILEGRLQRLNSMARIASGFIEGSGAIFRMRVPSASLVKKTGSCRFSAWPRRLAGVVSEKIRQILRRRLSGAAAGMVAAMVLGDKVGLSPLVYQAMMRTGTVHILVVSGFNVGIVCCLCAGLFKILRCARSVQFLLGMPLVALYCLMSGASDPVVRATVMAFVGMAACIVRKETDLATACSIAALAILWFRPQQLFDIGFQLSFASVISLAGLYPRLRTWFCLERIRRRALAYLAEAATVSLCCWLATVGLVAWYFKMVSPITVLANMVIVPLATLITLSGYSLIAAHFLSSYLAWCFAPVIELLVFLLIQLNSLLLKAPFASKQFSC